MAWDPPSNGNPTQPTEAKSARRTSGFSVADAAGKAAIRAQRFKDKVGDTADKVGDTADKVGDIAADTAGKVAGIAADTADKAADATGCVGRLLKRIVFVVLFPLWVILMLFGCGPLS